MTTITVCMTCRRDKTNENPYRDGERLLDRLDDAVREADLSDEIAVRGITCMSACKMACAAQISADHRFTYVLADLDPDASTEDLIAFAKSHAEKENGLVIKSQRPEAIKGNVIARVPPPGFSEYPVQPKWDRREE